MCSDHLYGFGEFCTGRSCVDWKPGGSVGVDIPVDWFVSCESHFFASAFDGGTDDFKDHYRVGDYLGVLKGQGDQCTLSTKCLFSEEIGKALQRALLLSELVVFP